MSEITIRISHEASGASVAVSMSGIDPLNAIAVLEVAKQRIIDKITKMAL